MRAALATRPMQGPSPLPRVPGRRGLPGVRRPRRLPRREPLEIPASLPGRPRIEEDAGSSPLETWCRLAELWLRLHQASRLEVVDANTLLLPNWRHWQGDLALRAAVMDLERYAWGSSSGSRRGCFVQMLEYVGNDLFCRLPPVASMQGWPDGPTLVLLRAALFAHLASPIGHRGGRA